MDIVRNTDSSERNPLPDALNGDVEAQYALAVKLEEESDLETAAAWFKKAALQGHLDAAFRAGLLCTRSKSTMEESSFWFERAAVAGHTEAQVYLASMYETGDGVKVDPEASLYWLREAARRGHEGARARVESLASWWDI